MSEQKRIGCDPEKCAACDVPAEAKAVCAFFDEIVGRISNTPREERPDKFYTEAMGLLYHAIRVMFLIAPSVEAATSKVTYTLNHLLQIIDPTIGRIDIEIVDASGASDRVASILKDARDRAQLNFDTRGATKH